jgi:hypothetical protein
VPAIELFCGIAIHMRKLLYYALEPFCGNTHTQAILLSEIYSCQSDFNNTALPAVMMHTFSNLALFGENVEKV